jgi:hypothetical protein
MQNIKINDSNYISFDNTDWNSKALGYGTNEIYDIQFDSIDLGVELISQFENYCNDSKIKYTSLRIKPDSKLKKELLEKCGYISVETSLYVANTIKNIKNNDFLEKFSFSIRECEVGDVNTVKQIASNDFNYGRFFEDAMIDINSAKIRNSNWIDDLLKKSKVLVGECNGQVFGFMSLKYTDKTINLEFGGVDSNFSHLAYSFWYRIFKQLESENITHINALISANNIGILNLYSFFDFKFKNSYMGYRKIRK